MQHLKQQTQNCTSKFVNLSTENDKNLSEQLRAGFKTTIKWNIYRSETTNQTKNNNLNHLTDPTFTKVKMLMYWDSINKQSSQILHYSSYQSCKKFHERHFRD